MRPPERGSKPAPSLGSNPYTIVLGQHWQGTQQVQGVTRSAVSKASPEGAAESLFQKALTLIALDERPQAIDAFRQAVAVEPLMDAAWRGLGDLMARIGDKDAAEAAYDSARKAVPSRQPATPVPPSAEWIEEAERRLQDRIGRLPPQEAARVLRAHLADAPTDVAAMRLLSEIAIRSQRYAMAERLLDRALGLAPSYPAARRDRAYMLLNQGRQAEAAAQFERLAEQEPDDVLTRMLLAMCLGYTGDYARSLALYYESGEELLGNPAFLLNYADVLKYAGRRDDSVLAYRTCLELAPAMGAAWWSLANIKNEKFSASDFDLMRAQLASPDISAEGRYSVHYALGRALEQSRDYAGSFEHYAKGAALKRAEVNYNAADLPRIMQRSTAFFTAARFASVSGSGCPDAAPIFIVGLPRAGSTLVEQILACHSDVEGTRELPEISNLVREIGQTETAFVYPERLAGFDAARLAEFGARYIERTRLYRKTDRPFFIDKMPANWQHAGFIHMILPNAKIIDVRRSPMASCFAAFKQLFGHGVHYSYGLEDLAGYYNAYVDRMAGYDATLPGRIHRVLYERLVTDTESEIRRLLDACALPFEPACLRFWESERAVATPSSEQVRQPIFREALEQWRNYEPWLGPLAQHLDGQTMRLWNA